MRAVVFAPLSPKKKKSVKFVSASSCGTDLLHAVFGWIACLFYPVKRHPRDAVWGLSQSFPICVSMGSSFVSLHSIVWLLIVLGQNIPQMICPRLLVNA